MGRLSSEDDSHSQRQYVPLRDPNKQVEAWGKNKKLAAHLNHIKEIKKPIKRHVDFGM